MRSPLDPILAQQGVVILDGGLATELERRGAALDDELWSARLLLERQDLIADVHRDYLLAGADVITTASYQATLPGLAARGLSAAEARAVLRESVLLAVEVRNRFWSAHGRPDRARPLVAASIGPYGAYLADGSEYRGRYGRRADQLAAFHRRRLAVLSQAGADLLAIETIPELAEIEALTSLLAEVPGPPAFVAFSCCSATRICGGAPLATAVRLAATAERVVAVGLNCTPPRFVVPLLETAAAVVDRPLVAYPNRGERWDAEARRWVPGSGVDDLVSDARAWYAAGARLIGGCCRTTPDDIRAIRRTLMAGG